MTLLEEVAKITEKIELLHINDPKIMDYWDEMASLLITSEAETIKLLDAEGKEVSSFSYGN